MGKIKVMSENLANKIAAGEVIEKCASVVKELIENSIDAGSSEIKVELIDSGTKLIKVVDNGSGMDEEDALLCFGTHATSKLLKESDLYSINTLGFRGEALPSIASVSIVDLTTSNGETGIKLHLEGGKVISKEKGDLRKGTIIEVKDLFYNTPARLKYLNSLPSELSSIVSVINHAALSHTDIRFILSNNDKVLLRTDGSGNLLKVINEIYGNTVAKKMLEISGENDDYEVHGYISLPDENKSNRNHMITLVNGRVVRNTELNKVINDAYHKYKPDGRYPITVLEIETDPSLIDVNIHPSKLDIKFSNFDDLKELVFILVEKALDTHFLGVDISTKEVNVVKYDTPKEETHECNHEELTLDLTSFEVSEPDVTYEKEESNEDTKPFPELSVIGSVLGTYIVCHNEDGMYLIDQHAAAERYNYEKFKRLLKNPGKDRINLLIPINLEYSKDEFITLKNNLDLIKNIGIEIEEFGESSFIVRSHPTWFKEGFEEYFVKNILEGIINNSKNFDLERFNDSLAASLACHSSIQANTQISIEEMNQVIKDLKTCKNPYNCAHGRPTIIHYPKYELEKLFKRVM
ncbi:MAG: DNA mismatch repair endonuclease MutL [Bacilli bacterium]|nr:DNA mismatch repair endonuclease MutL [Bacilli bacterium]